MVLNVLFKMFVLTLCLSFSTRMADPTHHLLYPLPKVEYDDEHRAHVLTDTVDEIWSVVYLGVCPR